MQPFGHDRTWAVAIAGLLCCLQLISALPLNIGDRIAALNPPAEFVGEFICCQAGDLGENPHSHRPCRYNEAYTASSWSSWQEQGLSNATSLVLGARCCSTGYAKPSGDAQYPLACTDAPAHVPIPLGGFGCSSEHPCGANAVCASRLLDDPVFEWLSSMRCECASWDDEAVDGRCEWSFGAVPAGRLAVSIAACASGAAVPAPEDSHPFRCL
eukprot:Opistho-2@42067